MYYIDEENNIIRVRVEYINGLLKWNVILSPDIDLVSCSGDYFLDNQGQVYIMQEELEHTGKYKLTMIHSKSFYCKMPENSFGTEIRAVTIRNESYLGGGCMVLYDDGSVEYIVRSRFVRGKNPYIQIFSENIRAICTKYSTCSRNSYQFSFITYDSGLILVELLPLNSAKFFDAGLTGIELSYVSDHSELSWGCLLVDSKNRVLSNRPKYFGWEENSAKYHRFFLAHTFDEKVLQISGKRYYSVFLLENGEVHYKISSVNMKKLQLEQSVDQISPSIDVLYLRDIDGNLLAANFSKKLRWNAGSIINTSGLPKVKCLPNCVIEKPRYSKSARNN